MRKTMAASCLTLLAGLAWCPGPVISAKESTPVALRAEIEALKPAKHAWRQIAWKTCPLEALKAAREQKKPVIAWVFLGLPTDERC